MPKINLWGTTHVGRVRKNNEDAYALAPELSLAVVADGMGGAACGELAAAITIETIIEYAGNLNDEGESETAVLKEAVGLANQRVWETAQDRNDCQGMGSTVVAAFWRRGRLAIANVGDSRAYVLRDGTLRQVSQDQSVANELRANLGLTDEQISRHPQRNALTMAIGATREVVVRLFEDYFAAGDMVLLCSDGLYGPVPEPRIVEILTAGEGLERTGQRLMEAALEGGGADNVTVVLLRHGG